jgi:serine/threonine protein kinase
LDFKNNINNILSRFCVQNIEFWIEKEEFKQFSDLNFCNKNLYLLTNYYENGDIFDYLEHLEKVKFNFTEDFYWDLIFEMFMGLLFVHECGYIHIDIQPGNYLVNSEGYLKLNDFSLAIKKSELPYLDDIIEGDSRYISQELFHFDKNNAKINEKTDIFSLGLTLLELIAKIELPYNGELWHKLREENFQITENFFDKCNIKNHKEFMILISQMILPFEKRPNLKEIINYFPELKKRYENLYYGKYSKSCELPRFNDDVNMKILNLKSAPSTDIL